MKGSAIEWTNHTFNPWIGCTKVSPGCLHCYAEALNKRWRKGVNWGKGAPRQRTGHGNWAQPRKWNDEAKGKLRPRVFCASLADWLDDEVPLEWLADLLKLIHDTPHLDWLLLTKRPENWEARIYRALRHNEDSNGDEAVHAWLLNWFDGTRVPQNIWIGTTVEDQQRADERIPVLLKIPARVRFLSCEPLLGAVVIAQQAWIGAHKNNYGEWQANYFPTRFELGVAVEFNRIHWVICGGESGAGKRAFNPEWARSLRDQCASAGVPFFMKQIDKVQPIPSDLMAREFPLL